MPSAPFDWAEYLRLAENLAGNSDEASQRTAISRAYYFIYHIASVRATNSGLAAGGQNHAEIWKHFHDQPTRAERRLSTLGNSMKRQRESADYKATFERILEQLQQQLADAKDFQAQLRALPPTP